VAKLKTLVEFFTVALLLLPVAWPSRLTFSHAALWLAVALAWASAAQYLLDSRSGRRAVATGT
jgi:phosphatidylglycerophosphate synthase